MTKPIIHDARALLDAASAPSNPADPADVAASLAGQRPGLRLTLRTHKKVQAYEAWLWEGSDGRAYFSKKMANGRTMAWPTGASIERALRANARGMRPTAQAQAQRKDSK